MAPRIRVRPAAPEDAAAITAIYNEGIEERIATFETRLRTPDEVLSWLGARYPVLVVEADDRIAAFASTSAYRPRECYSGIAEFSIYVARDMRGRGHGRAALEALFDASERAGFWKLVSRVLVENTASRALMKKTGFREVGIYERHAQLDGRWRDVVIVEKLLGEARDEQPCIDPARVSADVRDGMPQQLDAGSRGGPTGARAPDA
jgi:L-amino acid N-acyltransferase YncA